MTDFHSRSDTDQYSELGNAFVTLMFYCLPFVIYVINV